LLQPPVSPVPLPQVAEPNIRFIPPVVTTKVATGIQDNTFFFERADGSDMIVAKFRNDVQRRGFDRLKIDARDLDDGLPRGFLAGAIVEVWVALRLNWACELPLSRGEELP